MQEDNKNPQDFFNKSNKKPNEEECAVLANVEIAANILGATVKRAYLNVIFTDGVYKGRKIHYSWWMDGEILYRWIMKVVIVPRQIHKPTTWFRIGYAQPTSETLLIGKNVVCERLSGLPKSDLMKKGKDLQNATLSQLLSVRKYTKDEIINVLDELTKASEIVEHGTEYFKE